MSPRRVIRSPSKLLGGLTAEQFMRRHWQRRPLLVRRAIASSAAPLSRAELFVLASREGVESRLVRKRGSLWSLTQGPFARGALPPLRERGWTLLVQGVDLHHDGARALLERFRFIPDARLDDLMISWAGDGGGVGAHVDSYDVFLLQARGKRRWRIARRFEEALDARAPLKVMRRFAAEEEHVLEPGDLLYLPPGWAHEGVAIGADCMTCSIGMRAPQRGALAAELAQRLAETYDDATLYRDDRRAAATAPAAMPAPLARFAKDAVRRLAVRPAAIERALGEVLSEPKPHVWFTKRRAPSRLGAVALDRRTRMLYDSRCVFINGEAVRVRGKDAALLRRLANERGLDAPAVRAASAAIRKLLAEWAAAGWLTNNRGRALRRGVLEIT
jgi:50S ribosomal protein L16 3-hydroxylase